MTIFPPRMPKPVVRWLSGWSNEKLNRKIKKGEFPSPVDEDFLTSQVLEALFLDDMQGSPSHDKVRDAY